MMVSKGCVFRSNLFGMFVIEHYENNKNIKVKFLDTGYETKTQLQHIKSGKVKDKMKPTVHGVGFIGSGKNKASENGRLTKAYKTWSSMLERCYCEKYQTKKPTYKGCKVCDEWLNFQNYADWHNKNYIDGFHLDKDTKVKGNKIYSPDTCCFVSAEANTIASRAKEYLFVCPKGNVINIFNLSRFCRDNKLAQSAMSALYYGRVKSHKGYTRYIA